MRLYGGDDDPKSLIRIANIAGKEDGYEYTAPVGSFEPNAWHLYDMIGNVWEWCDDWYDPKFYQSSPREDPHNTAMASLRVIRSGSWYSYPGYCRPAFRSRYTPENRDCDLGVRVAAALPARRIPRPDGTGRLSVPVGAIPARSGGRRFGPTRVGGSCEGSGLSPARSLSSGPSSAEEVQG